jgi:hypothetical protein
VLKFSESSALASISELCDGEACCSRAINYTIIQSDLEIRLLYESSTGSYGVHDVFRLQGMGVKVSEPNTSIQRKMRQVIDRLFSLRSLTVQELLLVLIL